MTATRTETPGWQAIQGFSEFSFRIRSGGLSLILKARAILIFGSITENLLLESFSGMFERHIAVNCNKMVLEGLYPE